MPSHPTGEAGPPTAARILVVDDDLEGLDVVCSTLVAEGFTIFVATTGDAALRAAARVQPDLILLSAEFAHASGLETCRQLKALSGTVAIPVVLISAEPTERSRLDGLRAGAIDYVAKRPPWDETILRLRNHAGASTGRRP